MIIIQIKLYQILQEGADENHPDRLLLLHQRRISTSFKPDWEIFKVGETVRQWISKPSSNYGNDGNLFLNNCPIEFVFFLYALQLCSNTNFVFIVTLLILELFV